MNHRRAPIDLIAAVLRRYAPSAYPCATPSTHADVIERSPLGKACKREARSWWVEHDVAHAWRTVREATGDDEVALDAAIACAQGDIVAMVEVLDAIAMLGRDALRRYEAAR